MDNLLFARSPLATVGRLLPLIFCFTVAFAQAALNPSPPPEPTVPPLISRIYSRDKDGDRLEDQLAQRWQAATGARAAAASIAEQMAAQAQLDAHVEVELIFDRQITQRQLDEFRGLGGEVTHVYESVSYGWNGRLALGQLRALLARMGDSLVQVEEAKPAELYLDNATRTGRVRPIWAAGFANNPVGYDGSNNITIGIVDSGVDESHTDLNGRRVFWQDYSADGSPNPVDVVQHGTHVMGIALGAGASAGSVSGPLLYSDSGNLTGVASGSFFPSPINLPATSINVNLVATWQGGGSTTSYLVYHTRGASGSWTVQGSGVTGTSPLTLNLTFTPSSTRVYSAALISNGSMSGYAITVSALGFAAIGDGFNKLRGVAPGCNWAAAKAFTSTGSGSSLTINAAIDGLVANRVANNIKVLNISLGITGDPGISTSQRQKVNSAVNNGVVMVCAAGNDGLKATASQREMDDPGRAAMALTVAGANDNNQLTDYTSSGFGSPGATSGIEEDYKPDLMAPGGSTTYYSSILSVDSNTGDGAALGDQRADDYYNIQGTSMASPFAAGCAALVIDALQQAGTNWSFSSSQHPRLVKMLLCATASESNANRDSGANNPTVQRNAAGPSGYPVGKDSYEGFGMINPDAAVEAATVAYTNGTVATAALGGTVNDRRVWARTVRLTAGAAFNVGLMVPGTGDFDLYLYSRTPGNYGTPLLIASSAQAGSGVAESINYTPAVTTNVVLVVKRVSGAGTFSLSPAGPPVASFTGNPTNGAAPLVVAFTNSTSGATNYSWSFGDGNTSTAINPVNTYSSAGVYTVTLTAVGVGGTNTQTRVNYVSVTNAGPPGLSAGFSASPTNGLSPLIVQFTNLSANATSYAWSFGDGKTSTIAHPANSYSNAGLYSVALTVFGLGETNTLTRTNYILVTNAPPQIVGQPQNQTVNLGANANFTVTATGSTPLSYQWRLRGTNIPGATASTHTVISAQPVDAGDYSVVVTNIAGAVTSSNAALTIIVLPGVIPVTGSPYAENFDSLGAAGTATPFGWYVGTGASAISSTNVTVGDGSSNGGDHYNFGANGNSERALGSLATSSTARNTEARFVNISGSDIAAFTISYSGEQWRLGGNGAVNNALVLHYSTDGANFLPLGGGFDFNSPVDAGPPNALNGNSAANRVTGLGGVYAPASPIGIGQIFYLRWVDDDNNSLDHALAVDDFVISFTLASPVPAANFSADVTNGAAPLTVSFTNLSSSATGFAWNFGDGNITPIVNPAHTYLNAGTYTVTLTATGPGGSNSLTKFDYVLVTNLPPVIADFATSVTNGAVPLLVTFSNLSANATEFLWNFGDGNISTEAAPAHLYTTAGSFSVTLVAMGLGGTNELTRPNYILATNLPPLLVVSPAVLDFGAILTGGVAQASFIISNAGGTTLNASASLGVSPFAFVAADSNIVSSVSFAVTTLGQTNLTVQFTPVSEGSFSDTLLVLSDGGDSTNGVSGLAFGLPVIVDLALNPPEFMFSFATVPGKAYLVQFKDSLDDAFWQSLPAIPGDGNIKTVTNVVTSPAQRFYRVSVE